MIAGNIQDKCIVYKKSILNRSVDELNLIRFYLWKTLKTESNHTNEFVDSNTIVK
jgi:hypothetical protein